jgi:hypothetical protein
VLISLENKGSKKQNKIWLRQKNLFFFEYLEKMAQKTFERNLVGFFLQILISLLKDCFLEK